MNISRPSGTTTNGENGLILARKLSNHPHT